MTSSKVCLLRFPESLSLELPLSQNGSKEVIGTAVVKVIV